ncbi:MAG: phosphoribosylanthranilate isomerase [Verrucomicrobia bacterium]|nr:phosphoribosylanthranilate isomerase [Verrucomicrobiota bacterium]
MRVRVKICGITCLGDAENAVACGADALGFMFYRSSKRFIELDAAAAICAALPPCVTKVGVFVNASREEVEKTLETCGLELLQFHGEESPEDCAGYRVKTMKAFRVHDTSSLAALKDFNTDAWLVDSYHPGERGGTGHSFQWDVLKTIRPYAKPLFLAGGLKPENIEDAIRSVQPFGVDVSSSVESEPGRKCPLKMRAFIHNALKAFGA